MRQIVLAGEHRFHGALLSYFPALPNVALTAHPTGLSADMAPPWAIALSPWQEGMRKTVRAAILHRIPLLLHCDSPAPCLRDVERLQTATAKRRIPTAVLPSLRTAPALARLREWVSAGVLGHSPSWTVFVPTEQLQTIPLYVWVDAVWWTASMRINVEISINRDGVIISSGDEAVSCLRPHCTHGSTFCVTGAGSEARVNFRGLLTPDQVVLDQTCLLHGSTRDVHWPVPASPPLLALECAILGASEPIPSAWGISMTLSDTGDAIRATSRATFSA